MFYTGCSKAMLFPDLGIRHPCENLVTSLKPLLVITRAISWLCFQGILRPRFRTDTMEEHRTLESDSQNLWKETPGFHRNLKSPSRPQTRYRKILKFQEEDPGIP